MTGPTTPTTWSGVEQVRGPGTDAAEMFSTNWTGAAAPSRTRTGYHATTPPTGCASFKGRPAPAQETAELLEIHDRGACSCGAITATAAEANVNGHGFLAAADQCPTPCELRVVERARVVGVIAGQQVSVDLFSSSC